MAVRAQGDSVTVSYDGRARYVFPATDCVLLPIPNTTVEMLAQYLAGRLKGELKTSGAAQVPAWSSRWRRASGSRRSYREALSWD